MHVDVYLHTCDGMSPADTMQQQANLDKAQLEGL